MAFDKDTRNKLSHFVTNARTLLQEEVADQMQSLYGIRLEEGTIDPIESLVSLDEPGLQLAQTLRDRIVYLEESHATEKNNTSNTHNAIKQLAREQAFTVLNRLAAIRMAEKRSIVQESVAKGYQSKGFKVFEIVAGSSLGEIYARYLQYIHCLFNELAVDLGALFDLKSPQGLLFPRENCLIRVLELFNSPDLEALWAEDETVGWIYQYYNDPAERKDMRDKSSAPRNSRELAVRNQFFTPRYVVEFLTDNTLGRIWYEMCQGQTNLKDRCRYLVRRPNQIFLKEGEAAPEQPKQENLSQEELLKQTVYIPHRQLKDPRTILMLDPACGSMHFGLYAFDLFEEIYHEAWDLEEQNKGALLRPRGMKPLHQSYADKTLFLADIPRLIIEHNIHGVDIDPRATQIAALSLWLRAHRTWNDQKTPLADRPRITKSHIVCAEPMPGDPALLKEFVQASFPNTQQPLFQHLLEQIFAKMQLAGEAGSLLKIEEEITSAVEEAKAAWAKSTSAPKGLFGTAELNAAKKPGSQAEPPGMDNALSALDVTTDFWERIEERIYAALRDYAELAETGGGFQRRLFAEDAARGFAFIDVCRKRYDVALMNPPFGESSKAGKSYLETQYARSSNDLLAAFVERGLNFLEPVGLLGAITSRTGFFLSSFQEWREQVLLPSAPPVAVADLGQGVLDTAMVETAAYCLAKGQSRDAVFIRLHSSDDRGRDLFQAVESLRAGCSSAEVVFNVHPSSFRQIPGSPFSYWVSESIRKLFAIHGPFEDDEAVLRVTNPTADEFRFLRNFWECRPSEVGRTNGWVAYAKGGSSKKFFYDVNLLAIWDDSVPTYKGYVGTIYRPDIRPASLEFFFRPGIMWPLRAPRLCAQMFPEGTVFSARSQCLFAPREKLAFYLGLLNSCTLDYLFKAALGRTDFPEFIVGILRKLPKPIPSAEHQHLLSHAATKAAMIAQRFAISDEVGHLFVSPILLWSPKAIRLAKASGQARASIGNWVGEIESIQAELDTLSFEVYSIGDADKHLIRTESARFRDLPLEDEDDGDGVGIARNQAASLHSDTSALVGWLIGSTFGRWDIRYATGEQAAPELPDPFAPLPVCPPGQLQNAQGLPARPEDVPAAYPVRIPWDGILVDDPNHPLDIEHRIREVMEIIWSGKEGGPSAEAIEHEACEILGVKSLRDYFRKPAGFFADHLKRYSKSRRQAPIYWPLATKSGSYTLWIYYHRLTDQTLHTCLIDFVIPKLKSIGNEIGNLRESKITGERLEALLELQEELSDFKAELEEIIKLPWKPNLNDGVIINAAPLWKLFRLPAWQKKLKSTWDELTKGDYDWAHLAYTIWPERVKEACKTDRSMAIAHGLEHLCTIEAPKAKAKRKVKVSSEEEAELDLFSNAPEIEEAEDSITIPPKGRKSTARKPSAGEKVTRPRGRPAKAPKSDNPQGDK